MIAVRRWGEFSFLILQLFPLAKTPFGLFPVFPDQLTGGGRGKRLLSLWGKKHEMPGPFVLLAEKLVWGERLGQNRPAVDNCFATDCPDIFQSPVAPDSHSGVTAHKEGE